MLKAPRLMLLGLLLLLGGCIVVTEGNEWEGGEDNGWEETQNYNRAAIADLQLGTPLSEVRDLLGTPAYSEATVVRGREFLVLRYRTQHRHSDGDTSLDETTGLVFENGHLVGWGDTALRSIPGLLSD